MAIPHRIRGKEKQVAVSTPVVVSGQDTLPETIRSFGTVVELIPERIAAALAGVLTTPPERKRW